MLLSSSQAPVLIQAPDGRRYPAKKSQVIVVPVCVKPLESKGSICFLQRAGCSCKCQPNEETKRLALNTVIDI